MVLARRQAADADITGLSVTASVTAQDPHVSSLRLFLREELSLRCHVYVV